MTHDSERAMVMYAQLASISGMRRHDPGRNRFLILTGIEATRAGWLEVAARCHTLLRQHSPHHGICRYPTFADALRDEEFANFVRQAERFCPPERAEHLLAEMQAQEVHANSDEALAPGRSALNFLETL